MKKKKKKQQQQQQQQQRRVKRVYYDVKNPGSFGGVAPLVRATKLGADVVGRWLSFEDAYTLHKPVRRRFTRRRTLVGGIDHQWQADLIDVHQLKRDNEGYVYLLTCIDVFSKYAWVVPLKDKTGRSLTTAFREIFSSRRPFKLQTDKGTEFKNRVVQKYLREVGVDFFTTENDDIKASVVERFNRTLKERLWRYFTQARSTRYLDVLPSMVSAYNRSFHGAIGRAPSEVTVQNQEDVWHALYSTDGDEKSEKKPTLKVGDRVRLSKTRRTFKKGYLPSWTRELFTVAGVLRTTPTTYTIRDDQGEVLQGTFYAQELQRVGEKDRYEIETILDQRVGARGEKQYLVKWLGYPSSFNEWVPHRALTRT